MKQVSGVDISHVRSMDPKDGDWERGRAQQWERWCRNWMGLWDSPYRSIQDLIRVEIPSLWKPQGIEKLLSVVEGSVQLTWHEWI
ncbi:hypothetical protein ACHAXR_004165 [Thalassiosira sp. AJA248-18]